MKNNKNIEVDKKNKINIKLITFKLMSDSLQ